MRVDWKDDVFENARKYKMVNNDDGTVSLEDSTTYTQQGDSFGAKELNEIGKEINDLTNEMKEAKKSVSDGKTLIAAAITLKRVATAATDTFAVMAEKIGQIVLGSGNATTGDVLKGKTFTNDNGVEYTGTLEDKSNTKQEVTASLDTTNKRVQMVAPTTGKYTNGTSVLYTTYEKLASLIGLTADKLWTGVTILGLKSSRSALVAKTWTPGTANQTIASGVCLTGAQTIKGDSNLKAANIKKGVSIFGVAGTWEGYVAGANDLYYKGVNAANFTFTRTITGNTYAFCDTYIEVDYGSTSTASIDITAGKSYNMAGKSNLKVEFTAIEGGTSGSYSINLYDGSTKVNGVSYSSLEAGSTYIATIPLSSVQKTFAPRIAFIPRNLTWQIKRIWIE